MASTSVIAYGKFQPSGISGEVTSLGSHDLGSRDLGSRDLARDTSYETLIAVHLDTTNELFMSLLIYDLNYIVLR